MSSKSEIEIWKSRVENWKRQIADVQHNKTYAMKHYDETIAAQSNPANKKRYREEKARRKLEFARQLENLKKNLALCRASKPK